MQYNLQLQSRLIYFRRSSCVSQFEKAEIQQQKQ